MAQQMDKRKKVNASVRFANAYITDIEMPLIGTSTGVSFGRHYSLCPETRTHNFTGCITYVTMKAGRSPVALSVSNYVLDEASGIAVRGERGEKGSKAVATNTLTQIAEIMHQLVGSSLLFSLRAYVFSEEEETFKKAPLKLGLPGEEDKKAEGVERITSLFNESVDLLHTAGGFLSFMSATDYSSLKSILGKVPSPPVNGTNGWEVPYVEVLAYKHSEEEGGVVIYPPLGYGVSIVGYPVEGRDGWVYATALLPNEAVEGADRKEGYSTYLVKLRRYDDSNAIGGTDEFDVEIIDEVPNGMFLAGPDLDAGSIEKRAVYYDMVSESYAVCELGGGEHMRASCQVIADDMEPYPAAVWQGWLIALESFAYRVYSGKASLLFSAEEPEEIRAAMRVFPPLAEKHDYLKGKTVMGSPVEVYPPKWSAEYRMRTRVRLYENRAVFMYKSMVVTFGSSA